MEIKGNIKFLAFSVLCILFLAYSFFVYTSGTQLTKDSQIVSQSIIHGKLLWQKHNCNSCHQLYGLGGYLGPDLTTVISQKGKGRQYAGAFIQTGTLRMPSFGLKEPEIQSLLDYLEYVNITAEKSELNLKNINAGIINE